MALLEQITGEQSMPKWIGTMKNSVTITLRKGSLKTILNYITEEYCSRDGIQNPQRIHVIVVQSALCIIFLSISSYYFHSYPVALNF